MFMTYPKARHAGTSFQIQDMADTGETHLAIYRHSCNRSFGDALEKNHL